MEGGRNTGGLLCFNILNNKKKNPKLKHLLFSYSKKQQSCFGKSPHSPEVVTKADPFPNAAY